MNLARFLLDTSALVRLLRDPTLRAGWEQQITAGLLAVCPIVELEVLYAARSKADREELLDLLGTAFVWVPVPDRAFTRAAEVQSALTARGTHRSAGVVDLLVAAAAELQGLTSCTTTTTSTRSPRLPANRWYGWPRPARLTNADFQAALYILCRAG